MNRAAATADSTAVKYRPDIDGLRALAILPVVWFHSGLPGLPGGFTGVDTFFVISGYLITLIIHREVASDSFTFARFYERRVRRIAPALVVVTLATTLAAYALLLPYELEQFGRSAIATIAMVSNVYFWRVSDYFADADRILPLLHTWSLGVEEQFYLLFPAMLLVAERWKLTKATVAVLGLGSFGLCIAATSTAPAAAFYLLPTRGWELMLGAALAVGLVAVPARLRSAAGLAGIALIVAAAVLITGANPFPGWRAAVPALGAALVISAGPQTLAGRMLSILPLTYVGKISYSLYLWHWPVFVFMRHWSADLQLPPLVAAGGIALSAALASLTYRWIECPARRKSVPYRAVLIASGIGAALIVAASLAAIIGRGLPQRLPARVAAIAQRREARAPLLEVCNHGVDLRRCHIGPPGKPAFILWGDSYASAMSEGVAAGLGQPGVVMALGGCPPAIGWTDLKGRDARDCLAFNRQVLDYASGVSTVVLVWNDRDAAEMHRAVQAAVDRLHGKRVIVIAGMPHPGVDVPWASAIRARFGREPLRLGCAPSRLSLRGATVIDVSQGFCRGQPAWALFVDGGHISREAGLDIIAPRIRESGRAPVAASRPRA